MNPNLRDILPIYQRETRQFQQNPDLNGVHEQDTAPPLARSYKEVRNG
jgi:hypothetical protein